MLNQDKMPLIAMAGEKEILVQPRMLNRHGLITGATGTGKTVSLQTLAETFSQLGIPIFMVDVKGDLSGIAMPGGNNPRIMERVEKLGLAEKGYSPTGSPICFWDVFGRNGHPLRTTISDAGPLLLARLLNLNDVQAGILQIIFRIADDQGLLLLDLKDLRGMTSYVGEEREKYRLEYGQISPASIGAIQRALLRLEEEGGDLFFGEPALNVDDLLQTENGKGIINVLDGVRLVNSPGLYSCVLFWLLSELYERLPEAGDMPKPRIVLFFDEAHLLFDNIPAPLLQKIEQVVRLIRSRGAGIFFVSQNPADIPDNVLGQLGNRVQHALRAFTPKEQKAVRAAAAAFRENPGFSTGEAISSLGSGEALVSFLDGDGVPQMVEKALIVPPQSQIGTITVQERKKLMAASPMAGVYDRSIDRESAYEILQARAASLQAAQQKEAESKKAEKPAGKRVSTGNKSDIFGSLLESTVRQTSRSVGATVGRELGKSLLRGILGSLLGGKR